MRKLILTFTILATSYFLGYTQNISCGMWYDSVQTYHFASVNTFSGQMIFNNILPTIQTVTSQSSLIDAANNLYIIKGNYPNSRYFSIDISTGTIVNDVAAPEDIRLLQIHPLTGVVYGLWYDSSNIYHFVSVNPQTGLMTHIYTLNNLVTATSETAVINPLTNQYIFSGNYPASRYFTIDISNGTIINDTAAPDDIRMLKINPATGIIYGLWYDSFSVYHFVSINTLTGQKTVINTLSNISSITSETAVLNPSTNQYIFKCNYPASRYFTIDISNGIVVNDTVAPDDVRALQLCGTLTSINEKENYLSYKIFPNPFTDKTFLQVNSTDNQKLRIKLFNVCGREMVTSIILNETNVEIDRGNLPSGIYILQLWKENQLIANTKLIAL